MRLARSVRGLYGIVDLRPDADLAEGEGLACALLDGGARILQLRMKQAEAATMLTIGAAVQRLARAREALFVVNDRLDVALALGADGAHLGQEDLPITAARPLCPPGFLIGVSTHSREQAEQAVAEGADYLGFGPVFPTRSKDNPWPTVGIEQLAEVCRVVPLPVVAIGGITLANVGDVARAGATAVAALGAIRDALDPLAAATSLCAAFYAARHP